MTSSPFAQLLGSHRDKIVSRFVAEVQRINLSPPGVSRSLLVDHIPRFLDEIAAEIAPARPVQSRQDAAETSETARRHGQQRWGVGYDLEAVIREYGVLRHCVLQIAKEADVGPSIDEFDGLAKCLSVGVAEAAKAYIEHRDAQLNAEKGQLEFLAEAGQLLSSSLDHRSTLVRLTGLVVPRLADWCAVRLDDSEVDDVSVSHVDPSKLGLLRDLYRRRGPAGAAAPGYPGLARSAEPQLVAEMDPAAFEAVAEGPVQLALLQGIGACSLIVVPLRVQGGVFGSLTLGRSDAERHFGERDLVLATELGRRASAALDNVRLYELSQRERSRVEAATRAKDEFVAMVSHELRTPLNAILGWLRLLRGGALPEPKRAHALDVIERNAQAQCQLVDDLLDISRIITGKLRVSPSQVDLRDVVEMAIEGVRPAAEAKRIEIEFVVEPDDTILRGDGERLQQVVWNLLANAVKFTPKSGSIKVSVRRVESELEISVKDSGQGISAAFLPHVFEIFRQYDGSPTRTHGGLGIGLSISKHIVELHGGVIEVQSDGAGQGATFRVRLPVSPVVSATLGVSRVPATRQPGAPIPSGHGGIRVLVVDDEPDARELVAFVLESSGMLVRTAGSAAEARDELARFAPHVIVSDIGMPHEDGLALIRSVRTLADEEKKNTPAIALTAFARNEDRTRVLVEGFNLHMPKPVEPSALVSAVAELAAHARR